MQLFSFDVRPKLHRRKWRKLRVALFRTFLTYQQPVDADVCPNFIRKLRYKLTSGVIFTFIHIFDQNFVSFTEWGHVDRQCEA